MVGLKNQIPPPLRTNATVGGGTFSEGLYTGREPVRDPRVRPQVIFQARGSSLVGSGDVIISRVGSADSVGAF